jgi:hypothetical protein
MKTEQWGGVDCLEEGDTCSEPGCLGKMHYAPVENCSCHINPPCGNCEHNPLVCDACGYNEEGE